MERLTIPTTIFLQLLKRHMWRTIGQLQILLAADERDRLNASNWYEAAVVAAI
jgi:hypothetical protein